MQTQQEKIKRKQISDLSANIVSTTIKEISPSGIRMELNTQGRVTGKYEATQRETVSLLMKPDRTYDWEAKAVELTTDGDLIIAWGGGRGQSTGPSTSSWTGEIQYITMSPRLTWLNNITLSVVGTANFDTEEITGKSYSETVAGAGSGDS